MAKIKKAVLVEHWENKEMGEEMLGRLMLNTGTEGKTASLTQLFEPAVEELPIPTDNEMLRLSPCTLLLLTKVTPCSMYALIH